VTAQAPRLLLQDGCLASFTVQSSSALPTITLGLPAHSRVSPLAPTPTMNPSYQGPYRQTEDLRALIRVSFVRNAVALRLLLVNEMAVEDICCDGLHLPASACKQTANVMLAHRLHGFSPAVGALKSK